MDYQGQKGIRGADLPSSLGSSTLHGLTCRHNPSRRCRAYRLQVRHSSTPWRIAQAPGDEESDELTLQASMCSRVSESFSTVFDERHVFDSTGSTRPQFCPVLVKQVDQTKASGTSAGQRPDPLAGAVPGKQPKGIGGRMKQFFLGDKMDAEKLKALGEPQPL